MKKNILLIISQLHGGGAEKAIANLSIYLSEKFNVTLVIYNNTHLSPNAYGGELLKLKLPFSENVDRNPFHKRLVRFISLVRKIRKIKKEKNIEVSISFLEASNFINILSYRKEKIILSVRSFLTNEFKDNRRLRIFKPLIKLLYKKADNIVVPASLLKTDLHQNFGIPLEKISVIYNYIDKEVINNLAKSPIPFHQESIFKDHPVLINVGRFSNPKGQWLLMPLMNKVKALFPRAKLVILGDGNLRAKLIQSANLEKLNVYEEGESPINEIANSDVYFLGHTKNPYPYLIRSTSFILSSVYEGFPNVIIEAMACSLPIISSDCLSGPREILSPSSDQFRSVQTVEFAEYGILTPVFDESKQNTDQYLDETMIGISHILGNKENRIDYQNRSARRVNDFQRQNTIPKWVELIL